MLILISTKTASSAYMQSVPDANEKQLSFVITVVDNYCIQYTFQNRDLFY